MKSTLNIRPFSPQSDLETVTAIYNEIVLSTDAIYSEETKSEKEIQTWIEGKVSAGFPFFVGCVDDSIIGFSTYGLFRERTGYRFTVEHSVHLHRDWRGRGYGGQLLSQLVTHGAQAGYHSMIGVIDAENSVSLILHEKLGFKRVAQIPQVAFKFGRWLDVVFVQKILN